MVSYSYNLDAATICCLSLRKDMNLRNSVSRNCKQKRLSCKDVKSSKRKSLKCRKSIARSVKNTMKTPKKHQMKPWLDDLSFKLSHISPVTSTPISRTLTQTVPCEIKLRKLRISNMQKSDQVSMSEKRSVNRKVSQVSQIIPVESTNTNTRSSRSGIILRSQNSLEKTSNIAEIPMLEKSKHMRNYSYTPRKQMCNVQKTKSVRKSLVSQKQVDTEQRKKYIGKSSSISQEQEFPITSTPICVNSTSKYESNEISRIEKSAVGRKVSQASQMILLESTVRVNESTRSSRCSMTLRSHHSSKKTSNESARSPRCSMTLRFQHSSKKTSYVERLTVEKTKPARKSTTLFQNETPIVNSTVIPQKQSSKQSQKSSASSQKQILSKCNKKSSVISYKKMSKQQKSSFSAISRSQIQAKCKSFVGTIPVDDLALSVDPFRARKVKSDNFRLRGKNTLKRKRNAIDALKKADDGYEDDIYESQKFEKFKELLMDSSESEISCAIATPKLGFQVTPLIRHRTPIFKDCFSPTEYAISRKVAEECIYRNKKRKSGTKPEAPVVPEKKKLEFSQVVSDVRKVQETIEKLTEDENDEDNSYFSFC